MQGIVAITLFAASVALRGDPAPSRPTTAPDSHVPITIRNHSTVQEESSFPPPVPIWESPLPDGKRLLVIQDVTLGDRVRVGKDNVQITARAMRFTFSAVAGEGRALKSQLLWEHKIDFTFSGATTPSIEILAAEMVHDTFVTIFNQGNHCWAYVIEVGASGQKVVAPRGSEGAVALARDLSVGKPGEDATIHFTPKGVRIAVKRGTSAPMEYELVEDRGGVIWKAAS